MDIMNLSLNDLTKIVQEQGKPVYSAKNIYKWIYKRSVTDFASMTDISKELRKYFAEKYTLYTPKILKAEKSKDGCVKFLLELFDKETIESVLIPKEDRVTLCVSTQVGCKMGCSFCCTATQGFVRDLKASEIVSQVTLVNDYATKELNYKTDDSGVRAISNLVYMGMGEPLDNLEAVIKSIEILSDDNGMGFGLRKITVSTCGLIPKMEDFKRRSGARLAISLNAVDDELRNRLMPVNKKYSIDRLINCIKGMYIRPHDFITIEYIMFEGLNNTTKDAEKLAEYLEGLPVKVNLIPFNPHSGSEELKRPSDKSMYEFYDYLAGKGVICNVRHSRGLDIGGACGQLKSKKG